MDRDVIKAKALDLFRKISFEKTSVSDIAQACGMGKGTLYLYFKNKDDIFSSILEERSRALDEKFASYYGDPAVPLAEKIRCYFENLVDEYFLIKDLLFGTFDKVQGRTIRDVFFKFSRHYQLSVDHLCTVIASEPRGQKIERLHERVDELMELMLGRMLVFVMINEWNDREGLKRVISPLSEKLFNSLVMN